MPQPLKEGYTLEGKPRVVLERPQHAAGIGLVASEWTQLESHLIEMVSFALFVFSKQENVSKRLATDVMRTIESLSGRLDVIDTIMKPRIPEEMFNEYREKIRPEIRRRAGERNRVVHGQWHICEKYPDDLILNNRTDEPMRYSVKDFEDIAARIHETINVVSTFLINVSTFVREKNWPEMGKK